MLDRVVCFGCSGTVDEGRGIPAGDLACTCPPPSLEPARLACPSCGGPLRVGARACPHCASVLATTRCAACMAWNLSAARHCNACGRPLGGEGSHGGSRTDLRCPRCDAALSARRYGDVDTDECDACGGLFVEAMTMERVVSSKDAPSNLRLALPERPFRHEQVVRYVRCPSCRTTMNRRTFGRISGIIVDVCRQHGVWFDAGELSAVLAFVEAGGLARARARELDELAEAARAAKAEQVRAAAAPRLVAPPERRRAENVIAALHALPDVVDALIAIWD